MNAFDFAFEFNLDDVRASGVPRQSERTERHARGPGRAAFNVIGAREAAGVVLNFIGDGDLAAVNAALDQERARRERPAKTCGGICGRRR